MSNADETMQVVASNDNCSKVVNYDQEGHEIPKQWYTFINIGDGLIEAEFKEKMTYGAAVSLGKQFCDSHGYGYIGTCDIFGRQAMRDIATEILLSE